jgi:hypothetical protein
MASLNNVNNNANVVNVGRTTPVSPGPQPAAKSIPVVVSTDQTAVPVEEQNKIQSEVALSLLGIPRAEVALGIFADVNTYDVNPSEWSESPENHAFVDPSERTEYTDIPGQMGWGTKHLPEESGALVEAPPDETAVLTSKRFFRYQPGRVSAATFGIKSSVTPGDVRPAAESSDETRSTREPVRNPPIRKYGIFDNFDGYYWETRETSQGDQFAVVRRTQSLLRYNPLPFGTEQGQQVDDHALGGKPPDSSDDSLGLFPRARDLLQNNRFDLIYSSLVSNPNQRLRIDADKFIDGAIFDLTTGSNYNAIFRGLEQSNKENYPDLPEVETLINSLETELRGLADVNNTADARITDFIDKLKEVAIDEATRVDYESSTQAEQIAFLNEVSFPNPTNATASRIAAKDKIVANRDFLTAEINAWVEENYGPGTTHSVEKCTRDVLFVTNAVAYDLVYGGNSATWRAARVFFYDGFAQTTQVHKDQTVAAYERLVEIIDDIVLGQTITRSAGNSETQVTSGDNANQGDSELAAQLTQVFVDIIENEKSVLFLPPRRIDPDVSWSDSAYTTAKQAIEDDRQTVIETLVPDLNYDSDDEKCARDMDFVIDAYINDLRYGGNGHVSVNATTYRTALLLNENNEGEVHATLRDNILILLKDNNQREAANSIYDLSEIQISAVKDSIQPDIESIDYGSRAKIDTIFSVYDKYLGYLVSESLSYDTSSLPGGFTQEEYEEFLKFKCLRDVKFVVNAYAKDLQYGGNASTVYNAKKYYAGDELQIYSQTTGGVPAEIQRHTYLQELLTSTDPVSVVRSNDTSVNIQSVSSLFNLSAFQREKLVTLSNIIINNFSEEYQGIVDFGAAEQFGDVCILRDGLIMTHAALYDPSLLLPREKAIARVNPAENTVTTSGRPVIIGQYVNYYGDAGGLVDGKTYYVKDVRGPKENILTLADPLAAEFPDLNQDTNADFSDFEGGEPTEIDITSEGTESYIETPVPFIFPDDYNESFSGESDRANQYDGMFPYMYSSGFLPVTDADSFIGRIDTAIETSQNAADLKLQIDRLNLEFKSWVRDHVDPTYYSVYEYRVPRSRFSGDSLDGRTRTAVYADNVLDNKAGSVFRDEEGLAVDQTSVWDYDFTKVTMLKIEFSWYGAVGALFLAYVPVSNGEARWVRVHHLRASNQLKISSLGNATLPITYLVYGGGSESRFGPPNDQRVANNYSSFSDNLVKYGASYYIDGGDRGTVRLYNHSSDVPTDVYGSRYQFDVDPSNAGDPYEPFFTVNSLNGAPDLSTYYMNASVITGNSQDQNVKILWVDIVNQRIFVNKPVSQVSTINLIVDRPSLIYGIKTKPAITSGEQIDVRNRVQVYPTRLSIGTEGSTGGKLSLLKTPIFQTNTETAGVVQTTEDIDINISQQIPTNNQDYLGENGDFIYGYFQAYLNNSDTFISVLGKLEKQNDRLFFEPVEVYNGTLVILSGSTFLKEGIFDPEGNNLQADENTFEKERLSSVEISQRAATPIPGTGTELASYYNAVGAQDFDLATYFDYNKEYISFPLTDALETLYLATFSTQPNAVTPKYSISASLTWEEQ